MAQAATANGADKALKTAQAKGSADDVRDQIAALQADMAELTRAVSAYGKAKGEDARAAAELRAEELMTRAEKMGRDAEAQLRSGYAQAEGAVRENPAAAVGIAAGIGFVLGLLSTRR
ncbi:glycine zipper domain-containing protein [Pseudooceanicola nitratireducens]|uniref:glycine zipper domain-containing protein n=1 Tax=Pseudooceanicola nitratireducens TaxID=517719 RepID=UPI001C9594BF|nr:DUF883 domain-containing protein [Pseudooceanicola nitratireducens]MBY6158519.1 DUF883 family protein [Pseudooceanicola nitratireducens]